MRAKPLPVASFFVLSVASALLLGPASAVGAPLTCEEPKRMTEIDGALTAAGTLAPGQAEYWAYDFGGDAVRVNAQRTGGQPSASLDIYTGPSCSTHEACGFGLNLSTNGVGLLVGHCAGPGVGSGIAQVIHEDCTGEPFCVPAPDAPPVAYVMRLCQQSKGPGLCA